MTTIVLRPVQDSAGRPVHGHKGPLYEVWLGSEVLIESTRDPEYDAARVLKARGLTGSFRTADATGRVRMNFPSIEEAAKWTVVEDDKGIRLRKWRPFPDGGFKDALKGSEGTDVASQPSDASLNAE